MVLSTLGWGIWMDWMGGVWMTVFGLGRGDGIFGDG